jgi:putative tryptophan/tyrosine transport system substrate-binding protein
MRRRDVMSMLGGLAVCPLAARAEPRRDARRIGVLISGAENDWEMQAPLAAFKRGLQTLGWTEGGNLRIDYRFMAARLDQLEPLAKELIALEPDAILVRGTPMTRMFQREGRNIPIVFVGVSDPVGAGLVASLARPGGNVTGHLLYEEGIPGKWMALLKEIAPRTARIALMSNPTLSPFDYFVRAAKKVAPSLGVEVLAMPTESAADVARTIDTVAQLPDSALVVLPDPTGVINRDLIVSQTASRRLPAVYSFRVFVAAGGLMSYDSDIVDHYAAAASYIDRILRGAKPVDLPVQAPVRYQTIINLKTAKALGLEVPPSLLVRADEVIE